MHHPLKNGAIRMCVDYRTLNSRTIFDQYPVPCVEEALSCLSGSKWFNVLDLRSGYHQISLSDADSNRERKKNSFYLASLILSI